MSRDEWKAIERKARWNAAHPGKAKAYGSEWREKNREAKRASDRAYYQANKDAWTAQRLRRRAAGRVSKTDIRALSGQACAYCGAPGEHVEHCTPISRGGTNAAENLVMACAACNLRKGPKTVLEFLGLWPVH